MNISQNKAQEIAYNVTMNVSDDERDLLFMERKVIFGIVTAVKKNGKICRVDVTQRHLLRSDSEN